MIGFVYIWRDRKHKRYYVGSHMGTIDDGYICSSPWMKQAYKRRPEDFKRRIIHRADSRTELYEVENKFLQMMQVGELGKKYYNLRNVVLRHYAADENRAKEIGARISEGHKKGKSNRGKKRSPEYIEAMKERLRGQKQSEETRRKRAESMRKAWENRPRTFSEEARENMRRGHLGVKLSPEHVAKRAAAQTGLKRSQETIDRMKATLARKREERTAT